MTNANTTSKTLRNSIAAFTFAIAALGSTTALTVTTTLGTTAILSAATLSQAHALPRSEFRRNRRANRKLRKAQRKVEAAASLAAKKRKAAAARVQFKACSNRRIKAINQGTNPGPKCKLKNSF